MSRRDLCDDAIKKYYQAIFRYCLGLLNGNTNAAEDCTQGVFLLLVKKDTLNEVDFSRNIRGWLYASAQRICKDYLKRQAKQKEAVPFSLDEIKELPAPEENDEVDPIFEALTDEEYRLLSEYYTEQYGNRMKLAHHMNLSPAQLARKIASIRRKLKKQT